MGRRKEWSSEQNQPLHEDTLENIYKRNKLDKFPNSYQKSTSDFLTKGGKAIE